MRQTFNSKRAQSGWAASLVLAACLALLGAPKPSWSADRSATFAAYFAQHWPVLKPRLVALAGGGDPARFYELQAYSNLLLDWAIDRGRKDVLAELLEVYALPLKRLEQHSQYEFYGGVEGKGSGYAIVKTARPYVAWLQPPRDGRRLEPILNVAQFLYAVTRGLNALDRPTGVLTAYGPVLRDHYTRWILGIEDDPARGDFQRRGWGCGDGRFNQAEMVSMLLKKSFKPKPSYCNVVTDIELWMIAGAVELLALDAKFPGQVRFAAAEKQAMQRFAAMGAELVRTRMATTKVSVDGAQEAGLLFDPGAWANHPDYRYAGVTTEAFPTSEQAGLNPPPGDIAFDVSHARRLVQVMETLFRNRAITGSKFPSDADMRALGNQFGFALFDGNYRLPRFRNYISGSNGWYRVNYSGRQGFGYPPYGMSIEWIGSGYCRFEKYQPKLRKICDAVLGLLQAQEPDRVRHRDEELSRCFYQDRKRQHCGSLEMSASSFHVLNLLSSLAD